jgi:HDOD domain
MVLNERSTFSIQTDGRVLTGSATAVLEQIRDLPDIPVLSETLLLMELKAGERAVDLREISHLILSDLGAAIQIMRLAASEDFSADGRLTRIEDCISGLGLQACLDAMSRRPLKRGSRQPAVLEAWLHARITAENSRFLAEQQFPDVNPDEAYVVGLLHAIGLLPGVLGWDRAHPLSKDPILAGLRMAEAWSLPYCVMEYFSALRMPHAANGWADIVRQAHQQADLSLMKCPVGGRLPLGSVAMGSMQLVGHHDRLLSDEVAAGQIAFG